MWCCLPFIRAIWKRCRLTGASQGVPHNSSMPTRSSYCRPRMLPVRPVRRAMQMPRRPSHRKCRSMCSLWWRSLPLRRPTRWRAPNSVILTRRMQSNLNNVLRCWLWAADYRNVLCAMENATSCSFPHKAARKALKKRQVNCATWA